MSHSKNGLQPQLILYYASVDTEAPNQSLTLFVNGPLHCLDVMVISIYFIVDYNPLMGDSGGGVCFRPPRHSGGGG